MNIQVIAFAAAFGLFASPVFAQTRAPTDTGNMAYPTPMTPGIGSTTATTGLNHPTDTGNMAYPAAPSHSAGTTTITR